MNEFVNLKTYIPGLQGIYVHAVKENTNLLESLLEQLGFQLYTINGDKINDKKSFFGETAEALNLPDYFEPNWDDFDDCFSELQIREARKVAILWRNAYQSFYNDVQIFVDAVCTFASFAEAFRKNKTEKISPLQLEIFLLGREQGFKTDLDLDIER